VRHRAVSTIDDLDTLEAEERKLILDELAAKFAANGFNLRWLIEAICLTKAYQQASTSSAVPGSVQRPVRALSPDQVFAGLDRRSTSRKVAASVCASPRRGRPSRPGLKKPAARPPRTSKAASPGHCCS